MHQNTRDTFGCDLLFGDANFMQKGIDYDNHRHIQDFAADVQQLVLRYLDPTVKFDIYAHSMGGLVARHPYRIAPVAFAC